MNQKYIDSYAKAMRQQRSIGILIGMGLTVALFAAALYISSLIFV